MEISIIVPTYKRPKDLKECLESFCLQNYPVDKFEVVIVDDSPDKSGFDIYTQLKDGCLNLKYFNQMHKGPAAARNLGVKKSQADIVAFVDDDCVADKNWLTRILQTHKLNPDILAVGGLTLLPNNKVTILVSQFLSSCSIETFVNSKKEVIFFPTCNVSFKKSIFNKYKFNEKFLLPGGEDLEFFWRLVKAGYKFKQDEKTVVTHYRKVTLISFIKQAYIYGRGNFLVQRIHGDHPLLKELNRDKGVRFWISSLQNFIKIPRFSYILGQRLIKEYKITSIPKMFLIYFYFCLHKVFYILGNIMEYMRLLVKQSH